MELGAAILAPIVVDAHITKLGGLIGQKPQTTR
jgi:hypothetical protein